MACVAFPDTYKTILSPEQLDYMMEWMYSPENLRRQMAEGHVYYIAYKDGTPCGYLSVQPEADDLYIQAESTEPKSVKAAPIVVQLTKSFECRMLTPGKLSKVEATK